MTETVSDWVLVPREPMPEMLAAWYGHKNGHHFHGDPKPTDTSDYGAYAAMLKAAPAIPRGDKTFTDAARVIDALSDAFFSLKTRVRGREAEIEVLDEQVATLKAENAALKSDLTRYIDIATKEATEAESLRAERDAALAAEDAAKDCFWAIYPDWAEMKGHGLTTEAAKSMLAERVSTLTRQLEEAREGNNTLTFLLDEALPYLETVTDEGPFDEGWRSQDLQNLIAAIRSLKQGERG
jgi:hypothetical protein